MPGAGPIGGRHEIAACELFGLGRPLTRDPNPDSYPGGAFAQLSSVGPDDRRQRSLADPGFLVGYAAPFRDRVDAAAWSIRTSRTRDQMSGTTASMTSGLARIAARQRSPLPRSPSSCSRRA